MNELVESVGVPAAVVLLILSSVTYMVRMILEAHAKRRPPIMPNPHTTPGTRSADIDATHWDRKLDELEDILKSSHSKMKDLHHWHAPNERGEQTWKNEALADIVRRHDATMDRLNETIMAGQVQRAEQQQILLRLSDLLDRFDQREERREAS